MEDTFPKIKNFHVHAEMKGGKLTMLYKIMPEAVSKSYGIFVMQSTGFPQQLLDEASSRIEILEKRNNEVRSKRQSMNVTVTGKKNLAKQDDNKMDLENIGTDNLRDLLSEYSKNLS